MELSGRAFRRTFVFGAAALAALFADDSFAAARRSAATEPKCPTIGTKVVTFSKLIDNASFVTGDGVEVKLAGVLAASAGGETVAGDQLATTRNALSEALHAGSITLEPVRASDRYGRMVAEVFAGDVWIQGALLRQGLMRAAPDEASAICAAALLTAENDARERRAGLWGDRIFAIRSSTDLKNRIGTFQIVEGRVVTATLIKGRAYLNFGPDYKTDFTVTIAPTELRLFRRAKIDPRELAGRTVRVRGWLGSYNGPEMELSAAGALEMLN